MIRVIYKSQIENRKCNVIKLQVWYRKTINFKNVLTYCQLTNEYNFKPSHFCLKQKKKLNLTHKNYNWIDTAIVINNTRNKFK